MGWAKHYIEKLKNGETIKFRPRGNSMSPKIKSGQLVTVEPVRNDPKPGDVVLCRVGGSDYLHLVKAVREDKFQIGNNRGKINGWASKKSIYGICISVEA